MKLTVDKDGFTCDCGERYNWEAYVLAHWNEILKGECKKCGKRYRLHAGTVRLYKTKSRNERRYAAGSVGR